MTKYRLAAFDFDGTLADSFGWFVGVLGEVAARYKFRHFSVSELEVMRGFTTRQMLAHLRLPAWKVPLVARHIRRLQSRDIQQIKLFDGVRETLNRLASSGIAIAIVSSNAEQNVRTVLGKQDEKLVRYFGCGASLLGKRPMLKTALRTCGVKPSEAIYIGDEVRDIEAAKGLTIASGAVAWGYAALETLVAAGPTQVFRSPAEIVDRIVNAECPTS